MLGEASVGGEVLPAPTPLGPGLRGPLQEPLQVLSVGGLEAGPVQPLEQLAVQEVLQESKNSARPVQAAALDAALVPSFAQVSSPSVEASGLQLPTQEEGVVQAAPLFVGDGQQSRVEGAQPAAARPLFADVVRRCLQPLLNDPLPVPLERRSRRIAEKYKAAPLSATEKAQLVLA